MAYIPTIHTFEDDVNENRGIETPQTDLGTETIVSRDNILIPEKQKSSFAKVFLTFISILFFIGAIGAVGYYYYTNYQNKQAEATLNAQAAAKAQEQQAREQASIVNNLKTIFPNIADGMAQYISSAVKKGNIIIVTIKPNDGSGVDNYSQLYAYILAHQKDLGKDLVNTFNLNDIADSISSSNALMATTTATTTNAATTTEQIATSTKSSGKKKITTKTKTVATSSTLEAVVNLFDSTSLQNNFSTLITNMSTPAPISGENLAWESKTLNNQDFQIANAGVVTLIYGYVKQNYLVFSVSLKDFFDTIKGLQ
jgi:type II secretory pathway pseudopilin PulG